jgi:hypothetical protein
MSEPRVVRRTRHGKDWTLEEFGKIYGLDQDDAERLFSRFGPSSIDLTLLMNAKGLAPVSGMQAGQAQAG